MKILDRFFQATECSPITIVLAVVIAALLWAVVKLYFRNTSLSNHIMESDKNNAVVMTELKSVMSFILSDDKNNAEKILTAIKNLKENVQNRRK